jgi:hypothetical protein
MRKFVKRHRVGREQRSIEKEEAERHGLFLRCWLHAWQAGRSVESWGWGVIVKSLTLSAGLGELRVEASQQSLKITEDQGTLFSKRFGKNCRIKQEL